MGRKQLDRRPDEKPVQRDAGRHDPTKPEVERPALEREKGRERPAEHPGGHGLDERTATPEKRSGGRESLEGERSDRESGRPLQLEDGDAEATWAGRAEAERDSTPRRRETEPTTR